MNSTVCSQPAPGPNRYDEAFELLWPRNDVEDFAYERNLRAAFGGDRTMLDETFVRNVAAGTDAEERSFRQRA